MTLTVVFESRDLCRTHLAEGPDPLWELALGLQQLHAGRTPGCYASWRTDVEGRLHLDSAAPTWLPMLRALVPLRGDFADFLTPDAGLRDLDAGCEAIACTPRDRLRGDLRAVFTGRDAPRWVRDLATGDRAQRHLLVGAVASAHRVLIAPFWSELNRVVDRDRSQRIDALVTGGVDALVRGLPAVRNWDGRTLELDYPVTRTLHLAGRGLAIVPSYFCHATPVTLIDPDRQPVLVYPIAHTRTSATAEDNASPMLVALLGRTRAACLAALRHPHTTSGLANDLGISIGTASKQAAVLRDAGLLHSQRAGAAVVHELTTLGAGLLADSSGR